MPMQHLSRGLDLLTLFVARGLPAASRAVLILGLANHVEKATFAKVAAAFALVETLRIAFDCGQDTISIRLLSRHGKLWHRSFHAAVRIKSCTWLGGFTLDLLLLTVLLGSIDTLTALAIALIGVSQIFWNLPINVMQARGWLHGSALTVWALGGALVASVATIGQVLPGEQAVRTYALLEYAALICLMILLYRTGAVNQESLHQGRRLRRRQVALYVRRGWTVCSGQLASLAHGKFDVLLVSSFSAAAIVADYMFAQRLYDLSWWIIGGAGSVMYANIARKVGRGVTPASAWIAASRRWGTGFLLLAAAVGVGFWIVGPALIGRWFPRMAGSIHPLVLFGFVALLSVANQYVTALLNSLGGYTTIARVSLLNLPMIVIAGSAAFYSFGTSGLLLSIAGVYVISVALQVFGLKRLLFQPRATMRPGAEGLTIPMNESRSSLP